MNLESLKKTLQSSWKLHYLMAELPPDVGATKLPPRCRSRIGPWWLEGLMRNVAGKDNDFPYLYYSSQLFKMFSIG